MEEAQARSLQHNSRNIYAMAFFQSAMIVTAVFVPIMQRHGLTMSQVLQTQALFALVVAITEVPSGYLADLWGRKKAILSGALLSVSAFAWLTQADSFYDFLVYETLMGIAISLNSGADLALLYDSQTALRDQHQPDTVNSNNPISRLVSIEGFAGAFAAIAAALLASQSLEWVLWAQCFISMAALWFALNLVEAPRHIHIGGHRDNVQAVLAAVLKNPMVLWTAVSIITFGVAALFSFWLFQKYWQLQGIPVAWFGYIWAAHCVIRGLSASWAIQLEQHLGSARLLIVVALLPVIGFVGLGSTGGWLGLCFGLLLPISRGASMVIFYDALNRRLDANFRATVNSLVSLGTRSIFILCGPVLGYLVDTRGVNYSFLTLATIFTPIFMVVLLPLLATIKRERLSQKPLVSESQ